MAGMIINNPSNNSHTNEQASASGYRLSVEGIQEIRSQAPCPNNDPRTASITTKEIEKMRQEFIEANGNDGMSLV